MADPADVQKFAYLQIADELRTEIANGTPGPGDRIPSIRELAERFTVAVQTAQKAITLLANEGIIRAGSTRGYFVSAGSSEVLAKTESQRLAVVEEELRQLSARVGRIEGSPANS